MTSLNLLIDVSRRVCVRECEAVCLLALVRVRENGLRARRAPLGLCFLAPISFEPAFARGRKPKKAKRKGKPRRASSEQRGQQKSAAIKNFS